MQMMKITFYLGSLTFLKIFFLLISLGLTNFKEKLITLIAGTGISSFLLETSTGSASNKLGHIPSQTDFSLFLAFSRYSLLMVIQLGPHMLLFTRNIYKGVYVVPKTYLYVMPSQSGFGGSLHLVLNGYLTRYTL